MSEQYSARLVKTKEFQWDRGRANIDHSETQGPGVSIYPDAMFPPTTGTARTEQEAVV